MGTLSLDASWKAILSAAYTRLLRHALCPAATAAAVRRSSPPGAGRPAVAEGAAAVGLPLPAAGEASGGSLTPREPLESIAEEGGGRDAGGGAGGGETEPGPEPATPPQPPSGAGVPAGGGGGGDAGAALVLGLRRAVAQLAGWLQAGERDVGLPLVEADAAEVSRLPF